MWKVTVVRDFLEAPVKNLGYAAVADQRDVDSRDRKSGGVYRREAEGASGDAARVSPASRRFEVVERRGQGTVRCGGRSGRC